MQNASRPPDIRPARARPGTTRRAARGAPAFSPQFRTEAVQTVIETGKPIAAVARDLGIHEGTLENCMDSWRRANPEPDEGV